MTVQTVSTRARTWLVEHSGSSLFAGMTTAELIPWMDTLYPTGWAGFSEIWGPTIKKEVDLTPTQPQLKSELKRKLGARLGSLPHYSEILQLEIQENSVKLQVAHYSVTELLTRTKYKSRTIELLSFVRKNQGSNWHCEFSEEVLDRNFVSYDTVNNRDSVMTEERLADKNWQEDNCYRPGTSQSPQDGPLRRLDACREDFPLDFNKPGGDPFSSSHRRRHLNQRFPTR